MFRFTDVEAVISRCIHLFFMKTSQHSSRVSLVAWVAKWRQTGMSVLVVLTINLMSHAVFLRTAAYPHGLFRAGVRVKASASTPIFVVDRLAAQLTAPSVYPRPRPDGVSTPRRLRCGEDCRGLWAHVASIGNGTHDIARTRRATGRRGRCIRGRADDGDDECVIAVFPPSVAANNRENRHLLCGLTMKDSL